MHHYKWNLKGSLAFLHGKYFQKVLEASRPTIRALLKGCVSLSTNVPNSGKMQRGAQVNKSDLCSNWSPKIRQADWARKHR
jgi:hypothetical protein